MRKSSFSQLLIIIGLALSMSACSWIGGLFPDKQKQYRYSSELPDLEVPPDLSPASQVGKKASSKGAEDLVAGEKFIATASNPDAPIKTGAAESADKPASKRGPVKHSGSTVTLAESSENTALIELSESYPEAWNDVSRALGRLKVEITDQNRSDGVFYVYYGGQAPKKPEDASMWDGVSSFFKGESDKAEEFRVKLDDKGDVTNIRVLNKDNKTQSEGLGLELLKKLHKKLTTLDQPDTETDSGKRGPETEAKPEKK
jgi:uncharacterized lipoprotein